MTDRQWIILRTAGPRTLAVASSLTAAGIDAWTPRETVKRRRPRSRDERSVERAIAPTFVFAPRDRLHDLLTILRQPVRQHPAFSLLTHAGRVPVVADRDIEGFRSAEADAVRRAEREAQREHRCAFPEGQQVRVKDGAWTGLTGVIEGGNDRFARVKFAAGASWKISTFLLMPTDVSLSGLTEDKAA